MEKDHEVVRLQQQVDALSAENAALRDGGFRGSKAEALMALEYDRIPNFLKTPRSIAIQRMTAISVMIVVPLLLLAIAVIGGINAFRDHQRSVEAHRAAAKWGDDLRNTVEQILKRSH
jgi:cell division protein FtsB